MTAFSRKYEREKKLLIKRLRQAIKKVANVMPQGFTVEQFIAEFTKLQPLLWRECCEFYEEYRYINENRKKKGKNTTHILSPLKILGDVSHPLLNKVRTERKHNPIDDSILKARYEKSKAQARRKIEEYDKKVFEDTYYIQNITPPYVQALITSYFNARRKDSLDVNVRYLIILEAGKYKSSQTIMFLKKVQSGDKNEELRLAAYKVLKQMHAPHVILHHKRDGKMTENRQRKPTEEATPNSLLRSIYNADFEKLKTFNVFVSHSSRNKEQIHEIMQALNKEGLVCYIDWVSDREQLKRELSSKETAEVIVNRIKMSHSMVYVLTKECIASKWSPWELGYAYAINKRICILQLEDIENKPEYLDLFPVFDLSKQTEMIKYLKE